MLQPGDKAPAFELRRLKDGSPFQLGKELEKGPVLLVFAKASCPTCRYGVPLIDRLAKHAAGPSGQTLLVLQEMPFAASGFVQDLSLEAAAAADEHPYPVSSAFDIAFVPSAFYILPDGTIGQCAESFDRDGLDRMFESLARANGRPPQSMTDLDPAIPPFRPG